MFRKPMGAIPLAALLALSACNEATAPTALAPREIAITYPLDGARLSASEFTQVTWEVRQVVGPFTADVSMSNDGGRTYPTFISGLQNATSVQWHSIYVASSDLLREVRIRVTVHDRQGDLSDEVRIEVVNSGPRPVDRRPNHPPHQYE